MVARNPQVEERWSLETVAGWHDTQADGGVRVIEHQPDGDPAPGRLPWSR
jgi:hypothetical protein